MSESQRIAVSVAQKRATKCRHFNGCQNKQCRAGVSYAELEKVGQLPCLPWHNNSPKPIAPCDKYATFTSEEIAAQERDIKKHIEGYAVARDAILDDLKRRFKSGDTSVKPLSDKDSHRWYEPNKQRNCFTGCGVMDCPVCKTGKLSYSRGSYSGHVHARCSTEGCVAWME